MIADSGQTTHPAQSASRDPGPPAADAPAGARGPDTAPASAAGMVLRRTRDGWAVGDEGMPDLISAIVFADLLAADLPPPGRPFGAGGAGGVAPPEAILPAAASAAPDGSGTDPDRETRQLEVTVVQLEHALATRVRVEQAIGVIAERHRLQPREAFDLLRKAARSRGRRVIEIAAEVVASAANPLLRIPEELARPPAAPRQRGRSPRRSRTPE